MSQARSERTLEALRGVLRGHAHALEPDQQLDKDDVQAAFDRWPDVYQDAADDRTPIWTKRHA